MDMNPRDVTPKILWFPGGPQLYTPELYALMIKPNKILEDLKWIECHEPPRHNP
jgi:hypothetical protein